ncbi:hypothetical protein [Nisaea nitritireducens]|uniref:hypothetical protein n=1 Tax=Nisaea nitritireducens TaxID=568392 RepID=UPI001865FD69|nr:hypothetical protein [Nisaea nitritireducens]
MDRQDDDQKRLDALTEAGRELDLANAELAGTLSGYLGTRLPEHHDSKQGSRERKAEKEKAALSRLEMLLSDPVYADLYYETADMLRDTEIATEATLVAARKALDKAKAEFDELMDRANTLPDGTKVFRDSITGVVYDEHGNQVTGDDLASIVWKDGAPEYNDYRSGKSEFDAARKRVDDLRGFQDRLGDYRNRLEDPDNPPSADDLRDMQDDIESTSLTIGLEKNEEHAVRPFASQEVKLPPLGG